MYSVTPIHCISGMEKVHNNKKANTVQRSMGLMVKAGSQT